MLDHAMEFLLNYPGTIVVEPAVPTVTAVFLITKKYTRAAAVTTTNVPPTAPPTIAATSTLLHPSPSKK